MKKLRTMFLLYILLPVILIFTITGLISFGVARKIVIEQLTDLGALSLKQASDEIDSSFGTGIDTLRVLTSSAALAGYSDDRLRKVFKEIKGRFPVQSIFMAFSDGKFVSSLDLGSCLPQKDFRFEPWYIEALDSDGVVVTPPQKSLLPGDAAVTVACKVLEANGRLVGVLGYNVALATFRRRLPKIRAITKYEGTVFSIFLRDGSYVMRSNKATIGTTLGRSHDDLCIRMRRALGEDKKNWRSIGRIDGDYWWGGFQKSRYTDLFVALEIPLTAAVRPVLVLGGAFLLLGLAAVAVLSLVLSTMAHKIARPVNMLAEAAVKMSRGDYNQTLPVVSTDELGTLIQAFNTMVEGLKQRDFIRNTFGRYVTQEVADQLLESEDGLTMGGESREISMLISDLRGFTAQTASMDPEKVLHLLNRYLGKMVEILLDYRAIVDEIEGDGILAFFGAPVPMDDHPLRAVACAVAMQTAMDEINDLNERENLPRLEMGIGVNTGTVVVGNIGSERRTKYGAVGSEVNFTGRIESYTVGGQVLISEPTFTRVRELVTVGDVVHVELKGIQRMVRLYDIRGVAGPYNLTLPDTAEVPLMIERKIPVRVQLIHKKVVDQSDATAWITHLSERSARIVSKTETQAHEEIRLDVLDGRLDKIPGEVFAKVLTAHMEGEQWEAEIRFTFISPRIRRMFRNTFMTAHGPGVA